MSWISDVVAGTTITALWGNSIRNQGVSTHTTGSARSSAITSPSSGMASVLTTAPMTFDLYNGQWVSYLYPSFGNVPNSQTTTSTTFTDLSTAGPTVTVTTGTSALVHLNAKMSCSVSDGVLMGFAVSGASTVAATTTQAVQLVGTNAFTLSATFLITGLTAGSNVFTAKYRISFSGTATFSDRNILVQPLP
jgi:hypothetical protein